VALVERVEPVERRVIQETKEAQATLGAPEVQEILVPQEMVGLVETPVRVDREVILQRARGTWLFLARQTPDQART
jgi:hypothetical protein